jgi:hypothetical protein
MKRRKYGCESICTHTLTYIVRVWVGVCGCGGVGVLGCVFVGICICMYVQYVFRHKGAGWMLHCGRHAPSIYFSSCLMDYVWFPSHWSHTHTGHRIRFSFMWSATLSTINLTLPTCLTILAQFTLFSSPFSKYPSFSTCSPFSTYSPFFRYVQYSSQWKE